jgi:hypothetical protein
LVVASIITDAKTSRQPHFPNHTLSHFKTTKAKFGAGIWSVMTKVTARTNGFSTSSTPIADAKTAADETAGLSDVDLYQKLGFEAYDGLPVDDWVTGLCRDPHHHAPTTRLPDPAPPRPG